VNADLQTYVLDSFAMLAYLSGETSMSRVKEVMAQALQGECQIVLSLINLGEVIYITERELGLAQAQAALAAVEQLPIEVLPATREAVLAAAHIKATYPVAYADAFAVAAAQAYQGIVLTGDPEFKVVEELVAVEWLAR
jgi:predicted nucleic acid-binding protein